MQSYGEYGNAALNAKVTALYQEIKNNLNILNNSDLRKELNALQGQLLSIVGKSYWSNPKIESIFRSIFRPHQIQIEEQYKTMEELLNDKTYQPPQIPKVSTAATTQAIK
ncbi:MAG: hypothetical protein FJZ58_02450, partial [Chlamydiae bacterium]|nr:hypothetical protein [Chlamydiota bacterium]